MPQDTDKMFLSVQGWIVEIPGDITTKSQLGRGGEKQSYAVEPAEFMWQYITVVMDNARILLTPYETYLVIDLMLRIQCLTPL